MYEMDRVHKIATKNKVTEFYGEYKRLRNQVTDMINATEKEYYEHINTSSKTSLECEAKLSGRGLMNQKIIKDCTIWHTNPLRVLL